jgi:hypothetical protein
VHPWYLPDQSQKSIVDELERQTDRGAGIIGAAFIERLLLQALKSRMRLKTPDDTRYTEPEPELALLLDKLKFVLPAQPEPKISAAQTAPPSPV